MAFGYRWLLVGVPETPTNSTSIGDPKPDDTVVELDGLTIYVETSLLQQLEGTIIDYVSALQGASFQFSNPNATGTCGCGTSFSV